MIARHHGHRILYYVWWALLPPSMLLWRDLIPWVTFMSHYAILATHHAGKVAERVEEKQDAP